MREMLEGLGFSRVLVLDAARAGVEGGERTLYLALWAYRPEALPERAFPAIHPYYPQSQRAYAAAKAAVEWATARGLHVRQDTALRLKPILRHLKGFAQGRNTISSVEGLGSRFHVQVLVAQEAAEDYDDLWEDAPHPLVCGSCHACERACPGHAIDAEGFHRERCLRNYMMGGCPVPVELRALMGNRLLGCDACQACCPRGLLTLGAPAEPPVILPELLADPKGAAEKLAPWIGFNLAMPNRVLAQGLLVAGNSGDASLLPLVRALETHPSDTVKEHARWAAAMLEGGA